MTTKIFSQRLRQALDERNISASQLSIECGISKSTMSQYLSGQYAAKNERLERLAQALGCDPRWLMGHDVPMYAETSGSVSESVISVFSAISPDGSGVPDGARETPSEFCGGSYFWLKADGELLGLAPGELLLLCRRQGMLLSGQTGIFLDDNGQMLIMRCEHRRDITCLAELGGAKRYFFNEETVSLRSVARIIQSVREW